MIEGIFNTHIYSSGKKKEVSTKNVKQYQATEIKVSDRNIEVLE